ncbi:MAG: methyltransferase domain-containing protein [Chloroflexi bacterium]|nr:MAG: methyltransferase domain-containing protein [Chloroflexota bacterium]
MAGTVLEVKSKEVFPSIFSRHAAAYERRMDDIMSRGEARGRQRVIDLVQARPGMRILDLACGPGTLTGPLAAMVAPGGEVVGVDLAPGMLERAQARRIPNARFEVMDIEHLSFPDGSFDAAACGHGLQFVPDLDRALVEARRVLRPGSRFAASVPLGGRRQEAWELLEKSAATWLPAPPPRPSDNKPTQAALGDVDAFGAAARSAGFARADVEVVEEKVVWASAQQLVDLATSWWDFAARLEGVDDSRRDGFRRDAVAMLRQRYPGAIETASQNHVLIAIA